MARIPAGEAQQQAVRLAANLMATAARTAPKTRGLDSVETLILDDRIMYTIGAAARKLKLLHSDVIIGFPLSVTGKSPYFDRG